MPSLAVFHVAVPVPLPRSFDYLPPPGHAASEADVGRRVQVPFGTRELTGVVVGIGPWESQTGELRPVIEV